MAAALELELVLRVVDRLKAKVPASENLTVEAALLLSDDPPTKLPAAIVLLIADDLTDSLAPEAGAFQRVSATVAVVHAIAARNTARGGPAVDPLSRLTGVTRGVLNGWKPRDNARQDPLTLRRGRLIALTGNRAVWQDEYTVSWRARGVQDQQGG